MMTKTSKTTLVLALALALGLGTAGLVAAQPSELLRSVGPASHPDGPPDEVGTRRSQRATLALESIKTGPGPVRSRSDVASTILLNLFPNARFTAELDHLDVNADDGYSWVGHVDEPENTVFLAVRDGEMAGNISVDGTDYQIRPNGDGTHTVREVDLSQLPPGAEPLPAFGDPYAEDVDLEADALVAMGDTGATIDVMVVYTADARQEQGGPNGIGTLIDLAVTETNQSYANSGIVQRLRLVHTVEVSYTETGNMNTDLNAITNKTDGQMDSVHGLRDTHGADAVVLLVKNGGAYCGIAWLMYVVQPYLEDSAFSVVDTSCATGYYSFGHELGHNMGARHDRYVDNTDGSPFTYNHGSVNVQDRWRTVMAYNSQCSAQNKSCTRIPYWSNPDVTYGGDPMGIPEGQAGAADNRKTLNNTAFTFANFRQAVDTGPQGAVDAPTSGQSITMPFTVSGWAVDQSASSGAGIDLVEVRAIPSTGPTVFLGNATLGLSRPDIGTLFGSSQFNNSGYSLTFYGPLPPGAYTLRVSARSSVSGDFVDMDVPVTVVAQTRMWMDSPAHNSSVGFPFTVSGWAFNDGAPDGSGVDYIHVWAFPHDGGSPTFLGFPTLGMSRPDVGSFFGSPAYDDSGFSLTVYTLLPPGWYSIAAYVHTTVTNDFDAMAWAAVDVGTQVLFVDTPQADATVSSSFNISGWAVDRAAPSGTGIDAVHVWAVPDNGSPAIWVGEADLGFARPDVGSFLGSSQFDPSGFYMNVSSLAPGNYTLWLFARSTVTGGFDNSVSIDVTVN